MTKAFFNRNSMIIVIFLAIFSYHNFAQSAVKKVPATTWGITPDPRAVKSGLFIMPREEAKNAKVSFSVTEPSGIGRKNYPVRGSIPLFRGELKDLKKIVLIDDQGNEIPVQGMATAFWPEGTAKFICLDFLTDLKANQTRKYTLKFGSQVPAYGKGKSKVAKSGAKVSVDTGMMKISFQPGKELFSKVSINGKAVTRKPATGFLKLSEGKPKSKPVDYALNIESVKIEEQGPVQTTIYLKGSFGTKKSISTFKGQGKYPRFPFHSFIRIYTGSGRMNMSYTFGFNGSEHRDFVRRYGLTIPLNAQNGKFEFGKSKTEAANVTVSSNLLLAQPHHSNWKLTLGGSEKMKGKRIGGWASLSKGSDSVMIALRNAWQQWPVSFRATPAGDLTIDIHGGDDSNFLDLRYYPDEKGFKWIVKDPKKRYTRTAKLHVSKSMFTGPGLSNNYQSNPIFRAGGIQKISELLIDFTPKINAKNKGMAFNKMLIPWAGKKRFADTRVFGFTGFFPDNMEKNPIFKKMFNFHARTNVDYPLVQHEVNKLYGWVDYPDSMDVKRPRKGDTKFNTDRFLGGEGWTNGEKANQSVISLYVASGWRPAWDYAHQMLLHTLGMDAEHPGGDMATGVTHRHCQVHWANAGSPRQAGAHIGWHWYYWLSGNNEILRSHKELWKNPLGVSHKTGGRSEWPFHPSNNIDKDFIIPPGTKTLHSSAAKGVIYHWVNYNRWQTTGEKPFVSYFESLFNGLKQNPYKIIKYGKNKGKKGYDNRLTVSIVSDKQYAKNSDLKNLGDIKNPPKPNFYDYYFRCYYGKTLVTEWAQLTGSKHAVDLLLMMGDYDWSDAAFAHPSDTKRMVCESATRNPRHLNKPMIFWLYYTHGQIMPAYYLLRGKDPKYKDHIKRMLTLIQARTTWPQNSMEAVKDPENYTFKEWMTNFKPDPWNCKPYGKNGVKNIGGHMNAVLFNLWFYRPDNQKKLTAQEKKTLTPSAQP